MIALMVIGILLGIVAFFGSFLSLLDVYNNGNNRKVKIKAIIWIFIFFVAIAMSIGGCSQILSEPSSTVTSSRKCKSCGREFTDDTNKSSIWRTNMCINCYNNYQWGKDLFGK